APDLLEPVPTDASDDQELLDLAKLRILFAVVHYPLGSDRTYPGKRLQLLRRCAIDIYRFDRGCKRLGFWLPNRTLGRLRLRGNVDSWNQANLSAENGEG